MSKTQTFFHVGYARAASTFLQKVVFPALTEIQYIPRNRFRVREKEKKRFRSNKVLMSREAGRHIYTRCDRVKEVFGSRIVISLRRQDTLAASNYRLHAKKGHTIRFDKYLDLEQDQGFWKLDDFRYMRLIRYLEKSTGEKPIVLIFEDYIQDPDFYIDTLCAALQCTINKALLHNDPVHKSYSDKQLRLRRQFADKLVRSQSNNLMRDKTPQGDGFINFLRYRALLWSSSLFMLFAKFIPERYLSDEPLIESARLQEVREYYDSDWQECIEYVNQQSIELGVPKNI